MFIAHFGVGFGAKSIAPKVSLGTLFLAAQFIDLLWPTLLLLGLEQVRIVPGATVVTPLVFDNYPISHSLLAVIGWAVLLGAIHYGLKRDTRNATILGLLVLSHWLLDLMVHQPDLPLYPGSTIFAGLNVWSSLSLTLLLEGSIFAIGVWLYARSTTATDAAGRWGLHGLVAFLLLIYAANLFGAPPPNEAAIAWAGHAQWLLVLWGYWIDGHRHAKH
ncbi:MAG: hypothetical protein KJ795_13205 [Gammaproteobacteria bacterium]|nr:hypothetical protein [Gammaproteobacteria bacterium]MBU1777668.1 hypothetical protein [Gammaproteobacteria bacterium]MBU1968335.1 hypothetical protein [Gammaproteobacteria bacterium]